MNKNKPCCVVFIIRQWWDRANGNTYSKGEAVLTYSDGSMIERPIPYQYGRAEDAERDARDELRRDGLLPSNVDGELDSGYYRRHRIARVRAFSYVPAKKDM